MSSEFQVNTTPGYTGSDSSAAQVATLKDGNVVIVWDLVDEYGSASVVRAQILGPDGAWAGAEFEVGVGTVEGRYAPDVAALDDGGFVLTWTAASGDITAQIFDSSGSPVGAELDVKATDAAHQHDPVVSPLSNGGFVVAWMEHDAAGEGADALSIRGKLFDSAGLPVGAEFQVQTSTSDYEQKPAIAQLADGHFVVAWNSSPDADSNFIAAQVFDADGQRVGSEIQLSAGTWGDYHPIPPAICALADQTFLITWGDLNGSDNSAEAEMKGQLFDGQGQKIGAEFQINTETRFSQWHPSATALAQGGFVVTWTDSSGQLGDASYSGITAQIFDAEGGKVGSQFLVNSVTENSQLVPSVAALADGGFLVTWRQMWDGWDVWSSSIEAQIYDAAGNALAGVARTGTPARDRVQGSTGADTLHGGAGNDKVYGNMGNDLLRGDAGNDMLRGDDGNDFLQGGRGNDTIDGGRGIDTVVLAPAVPDSAVPAGVTFTVPIVEQSPFTVSSGSGDVDTLTGIERFLVLGTTWDDTFFGGGRADTFQARNGDDEVRAGRGNDSVFGGTGDDTLSGGAGDDLLFGGRGNERLFGGHGNDTLIAVVGARDPGSPQASVLTGGTGADAFEIRLLHVSNPVRITDFTSAEDRLQLAQDTLFELDAAGPLDAGQFVLGTAALDAGDRILFDATTGNLFYDADGSGAGGALLFANLGPGCVLTANDIWVV